MFDQLQEELAARLAAERPGLEEDEAGVDGPSAFVPTAPTSVESGALKPTFVESGAPKPTSAESAPTEPAPTEPSSTKPEELQRQLEASAEQCPALRARVEESTARLTRLVAALKMDIVRAAEAPPGTVEKALASRPALAGAEPAHEASAAADGMQPLDDEGAASRLALALTGALAA